MIKTKVTLIADPSKQGSFAIQKDGKPSKCALSPIQTIFEETTMGGMQQKLFQPYCATDCMKCNISEDGKQLIVSCCGTIDKFEIVVEENKVKSMFTV